MKKEKPICIVLEAGHGDRSVTPGKRSPDPRKFGGPDQMFEGERNREIVLELYADLRQYLPPEIEVVDLCPGPVNIPIPVGKDPEKYKGSRRQWIDKKTRTHRVIHLSIHANAAGRSGWKNRVSGAVVFNHAKDDTLASKSLARFVHGRMRETAIGTRFKTISGGSFAVLRPFKNNCDRLASVLIEYAFMTNERNVKYMNSAAGKSQIVSAIYNGLVDFLNDLGVDTVGVS